MSSRSSTSDSSSDDSIVVAHICKPHGVRGELVVEPLSDVAHRLQPGSRLRLRGSASRDGVVEVLSSRPHKGRVLLTLVDCDSRDSAELLRGADLQVSRAEVPPAPEGEYYYFELIGCRCRDGHGGDLGVVEEIVEDGGGLLLRVAGDRGELLLPFVAAYLTSVDPAAGEIEWRLPDGMVEACAFRS